MILYVEFNDIVVDSSWRDGEQNCSAPSEASCKIVGFYLGKENGFLHLAHMAGVNDKQSSKTSIPMGCITKIRRLKYD